MNGSTRLGAKYPLAVTPEAKERSKTNADDIRTQIVGNQGVKSKYVTRYA